MACVLKNGMTSKSTSFFFTTTVPTEKHSTLKLMNGYPDAGQKSGSEQETEESGSNSCRVRYSHFRTN